MSETKPQRGISTLGRLVRSLLAIRTELLWHPDSPGMRVTVTRSRFGRWIKPCDFATLSEVIKDHRANALGEGRECGILREASSGEAATSTDGLGNVGKYD